MPSPGKARSTTVNPSDAPGKGKAGKVEARNVSATVASKPQSVSSSPPSTTKVNPTGTITLELLAFIPKHLGSPISKLIDAGSARDSAGLTTRLKAITSTFAKEPFSMPTSNMIGAIPLGAIQYETPWYFATDDREFGGGSYRLGLKTIPIRIADIGSLFSRSPHLKKKLFEVHCCESKRVCVELTGLVDSTSGMKWDQWKVHEEKKTATPSESQELLEESTNSFTYSIQANATYPFASKLFAPDIQIDIELKIHRDPGNNKTYIDIAGQHNRFPFYELLVNSQSCYTYIPKDKNGVEDDGPGFWNLSLLHEFEKVIVVG
jgi:hypothetical protein